MAQNEMKAKRGMPLLVRSMEGLGVCLFDEMFFIANGCRVNGVLTK